MTSSPTMTRPPAPPQAAGQPRAAAPAAAAPTGNLINIDPVRLFFRYWPLLVLSAIIGLALGYGAHTLFARYAPTYTANVTFVCKPPTFDPINPVPPQVGNNDFERFIGTQVQQMTSDAVLEGALSYPEVLRTEWIKQYHRNGSLQPKDALRGMSKIAAASPVPMSELIKLNVKTDRPDEAAIIANAIATSYIQDLQRYSKSSTTEKRDALGRRLSQIDEDLRRLEASREKLIEEKQVRSLDGGGLSDEELQMRSIQGSLAEIAKSKSFMLSRLEDGELILASAGAVVYPVEIEQAADEHPLVRDLAFQVSNMNVEVRIMREQGFGEDHPALVRIKDRIRSVEIERDREREQVKRQLFTSQLDGLRTQLKALEAQERDLITELTAINLKRDDMVQTLLKKEKLDNDIGRLKNERVEVTSAIQNYETVSNASAFDRVQILRRATRPESMSFPKLMIMLAAGLFLVVGSVSGLVVAREALDQRVRGPADLSLIPRLSVLGVVPDAAEDPARIKSVETCFRDNPTTVVSESFRQIRAPLIKRMGASGAKSLLVLGGMPGSGATTVASNLAISLAGVDERVLVIDANLRRPAQHRVFGVQDGPGLGDILTGQSTLESAVQQTSVPGLSVLSAGSPASRTMPERLGSEAMSRLIAEAIASYDRVIVDSAPAIVSGDGLALANRCDAVTLVVKALNEKRGLVGRLRTQLAESRGEFIGVIVNGVRASAGGYFRKNFEATHRYHSDKK